MASIVRGNRTVGFGLDGSGAPVLAFHGTTQARDAWSQVRAAMSVERTWVTVEFPGSGESSMPTGPIELDDIVADGLAVMDELGHESFDVVGYSLGAVAALRTAALHRDRVRTVTSLCGWSRSDARMRLTFDLWRKLISVGPSTFMHYALVDGYTAATLDVMEPMAPAVLEMAASMVQPGSDAHLELDSRVDIEDSLPLVTAPCLVMGGAQDRWVDMSKSVHIASRIPGSTLVELPAGHLVIGEMAAEVAAHISRHIGA